MNCGQYLQFCCILLTEIISEHVDELSNKLGMVTITTLLIVNLWNRVLSFTGECSCFFSFWFFRSFFVSCLGYHASVSIARYQLCRWIEDVQKVSAFSYSFALTTFSFSFAHHLSHAEAPSRRNHQSWPPTMRAADCYQLNCTTPRWVRGSQGVFRGLRRCLIVTQTPITHARRYCS